MGRMLELPRFRKCCLEKFWDIRKKIYLTTSTKYVSRYVPFNVLILNQKVRELYSTVSIFESYIGGKRIEKFPQNPLLFMYDQKRERVACDGAGILCDIYGQLLSPFSSLRSLHFPRTKRGKTKLICSRYLCCNLARL